MKNINKITLILLLPLILSTATSCNSKEKTYEKINTRIRDDKNNQRNFGNFAFEFSDEDLEKKGYEYGDIVNVHIFNIPNIKKEGYEIEVPEVNLVCPLINNYNEAGYNAPSLCNYQKSWDRPQLSWGVHPYMTSTNYDHFIKYKDVIDVEISMYKKDGYKKTLELIECGRKQTYDELNHNNEDFSNFRDVTFTDGIGDYIKEKMLFRGSSPYNAKSNDSYDGRHAAADLAMQYANIQNEISLCYDEATIKKYYEERFLDSDVELIKTPILRIKPTYSKELFDKRDKEGNQTNFFSAPLGTDYYSHEGSLMVGNVFKFIANTNNEENVYLHCNEGKDRTGFFIFLLEALCGCSLEMIYNDFMTTFKNYFNISLRDNPDKYKMMKKITICRFVYSIQIDAPFENLSKINWLDQDFDIEREIGKNLEKRSLQEYASDFIINAIDQHNGTVGEEIVDKLIKKFKK